MQLAKRATTSAAVLIWRKPTSPCFLRLGSIGMTFYDPKDAADRERWKAETINQDDTFIITLEISL